MGVETSSSGSILVVDDDPGLRTLVADILASAGFAVVEAGTGEAAITAAREARPRLVVLDVFLPLISGYEVCRALRDQYGAELPIVFLSGVRTEPLDRAAGLLLGGDDYVTKPFDASELLARVRRLLRAVHVRVAQNGTLTAREEQVMAMLASGTAQTEIATRLAISTNTVARHIEHILRKLDVHSRAEAVAVTLGPERLRP